MEPVLTAILLTLIAGLSTSIGALFGIMKKKPSARFISFVMASSAGVMVFLSFTEMFAEAEEVLGMGTAMLWMVVGLSIALIIDMAIPEEENVHEHLQCDLPKREIEQQGRITNQPIIVGAESMQIQHIIYGETKKFGHHDGKRERRRRGRRRQRISIKKQKFMRVGIFSVLALFIHNLPEGLATFSASLVDLSLGIQICIATALHNIPEGICVAVPIYIATDNKQKAFFLATLSGLAEPLGALLAWWFLAPLVSEATLMMLLAVVAGIMIYISVDSLIPTAKCMEVKHTSILGFMLGMIVMAVSLILF